MFGLVCRLVSHARLHLVCVEPKGAFLPCMRGGEGGEYFFAGSHVERDLFLRSGKFVGLLLDLVLWKSGCEEELHSLLKYSHPYLPSPPHSKSEMKSQGKGKYTTLDLYPSPQYPSPVYSPFERKQ